MNPLSCQTLNLLTSPSPWAGNREEGSPRNASPDFHNNFFQKLGEFFGLFLIFDKLRGVQTQMWEGGWPVGPHGFNTMLYYRVR